MQLKTIGVIMLGVRELGPSIAFYRDKLGLGLRHQFEGFAFFETGGTTLVLSVALARNASHIAGAAEVVFSVDESCIFYATTKCHRQQLGGKLQRS